MDDFDNPSYFSKEPVLWRVQDKDQWKEFDNEVEARAYANKIGSDNIQGLFVPLH